MALHVFQNIKVYFSVIINMLLSNKYPTGMLYLKKLINTYIINPLFKKNILL